MFEEFPWLAPIWQELCWGINHHHVAHAQLLQSAPGLATDQLAQAYAARLLCRAATKDKIACGHCADCQLLQAGNHPDRYTLMVADDKKYIAVDDVRDLITRLQQTARRGGWRVALVFDADMMNSSAANALLKTLEEPGADVVLILISERPERLPATIRSRCARLLVRTPEPAAAMCWLRARSDANEMMLSAALRASAGAPLRALEMLKNGQVDSLAQIQKRIKQLLAGKLEPVQFAADIGDAELALDELLRTCNDGMQQLLPSSTAAGAVMWAQLSELTMHARAQLRSGSNLTAQAVMENLLMRWFDLSQRLSHSKSAVS